jgi:hypothetical protein
MVFMIFMIDYGEEPSSLYVKIQINQKKHTIWEWIIASDSTEIIKIKQNRWFEDVFIFEFDVNYEIKRWENWKKLSMRE